MPSSPAPRKPANKPPMKPPPMKPGRLKKLPPGDVAGRCASEPPGWPGCVMLRSIGRAVGEVAVEGGAEKVCEPRLPKLPPRPARASASVAAIASTAAIAHSANSGRKRKKDMNSSQEPIVGLLYRYPT